MGQRPTQHIQRDFSGGEISPRLLMRQDTDIYQKSALTMLNYMPTPMGSAVRAPGSQFVKNIGDLNARIVPYITSANERSLLVLTPTNVNLIANVTSLVNPENGSYIPSGTGPQTYTDQIVDNPSFYQGLKHWDFSPNETLESGGDTPLGVYIDPNLSNTVRMVSRIGYRPELPVCTLTMEAEVEEPTNTAVLDHLIRYVENPGSAGQGGFELNILISQNSDYSAPVYDETYTQKDYQAGSRISVGDGASVHLDGTTNSSGTAWSGTLYFKITLTAVTTDDADTSNPQFTIGFVKLYALASLDVLEDDVPSPFLAQELDDIHFIQSPYANKELVMTHPKHPPQRYYFNSVTPAYVCEDIPFIGTAAPTWEADNYPATCTSYHGRLVLAGGSSEIFPSLGTIRAPSTETVWSTKVTEWSQFSDIDEVNPDDSIEFTAIYRSPIQWVFGQKTLLVGSLEYEYSASGEGIYAPGDLGVFLHSTHGSSRVQPAGFGESVLFPADGGTRVRSMQYQQDAESWVSDDLTLLNPEITDGGIVRMARVRTPRQMCWVVLESGEIAIWHSESGVQGWSRYRMAAGQVVDIAVVPDDKGVDIPFLLVRRTINGAPVLYLEAITNLNEINHNLPHHMESYTRFTFQEPTNVLTGLDHLEGRTVQAADPYRYLGEFVVTGGQITLVDDLGNNVTVQQVTVGMMQRCVLRTLPPQKDDPGSPARFSSYSVRIIGSLRPIINGERPADRLPSDNMGFSPGVDLLADVQVSTRGWNPYQSIEISEQLPYRSEVAGVYGNLKTGDL